MQSVLISVRPQYCELIASGKKTVEVRKSRPKLATPFKCYIYCTKDNTGRMYVESQQVIGEFVCDSYIRWSVNPLDGLYMIFPHELTAACLNGKDFEQYGNGKALYGWHISALQIYDKPRELSEFSRYGFAGMGLSKYVCANRACENYVESNDYDEPPECKICGCQLTRPPQSWCYVEELEDKPCKTKN